MPFAFRFIFVFRMAILRRSIKGMIKKRLEKDGRGAATSTRSRDPRRGNPKIYARDLTSSSLDQLYLTKLGDAIEAGPLQLACHVSRYVESTFSQFYQEYLLDTTRKIWSKSNHPDDT